MSDPADQPTPPTRQEQEPTEEKTNRRALRRKTIAFICVFLFSVFALLAGYELIKNTKANDWYLLQVADSTRFLLAPVGYSCSLGDPQQFAGREQNIREALQEMGQGETVTSSPTTAQAKPGPPLTPWEAWSYQSAMFRQSLKQAKEQVKKAKQDNSVPEAIRADRIRSAKNKLLKLTSRDRGPLVCFVLEAGPERRLKDTKAELQKVQTENPDATAKIEDLKAKISSLEQQVQQKTGESDRWFNFILVPDCGAIPSIAIFVAAVLAFPARWWRKLVGIIAGVFILYWVNAFRLAFLAILGAWDRGGGVFRFAHEYVWQGIYIIFVVAVWIAWVEFLVRRRSQNGQDA